jgi:hypothetical protein
MELQFSRSIAAMAAWDTKVPALAAVQRAEPFLAESLTKILPYFSTVLSTVVLKTFLLACNLNEKSRPAKGGFCDLWLSNYPATSSNNF